MGHPRVTVGHLRVTVVHLRATKGHLSESEIIYNRFVEYSFHMITWLMHATVVSIYMSRINYIDVMANYHIISLSNMDFDYVNHCPDYGI